MVSRSTLTCINAVCVCAGECAPQQQQVQV